MPSRRCTDGVDLARYLERIDYRGPFAIDAATLAALQEAHLLHVPFENLDIHWGIPITLDVARHYAKIVDARRGGFCYEQNALFAWALETLGFRVTRLGAGVFGVRDGVADFSVETSHMLLKVDLDRPWIADVGFGENFRRPLRLVHGASDEQGSRAYRLARDRIDDFDRWTLSTREPDGTWHPVYRFMDIARPIAWFAERCVYQQTSPLSHFTQKPLCSLATPAGRITLSGREWIATRLDGTKTITPIADDAEMARLLSERFGIETPTHTA